MSAGADAIQRILNALFACDDVLGVVAANREGFVVGAAGMPLEHAALLAALGAPLASVSERAMERLGGARPEMLTIDCADGMLHVRCAHDLALVILTERRETLPLPAVFDGAIQELSALFSLV